MSNIKNGGPAFPIPLNPGETYTAHATCDGMTLRDYFAARAMNEMTWTDDHGLDAAECYKIADAMLRAREAA